MIERQQLLNAVDRLAADEPVVLATVVKVEGSAYRRPGARMLIPRYGSTVGTVSGGCLESEISKKAWWLTESGHAVVRRYTTASLSADGEPPAGQSSAQAVDAEGDAVDEAAELGFGLGCNGTVHVLLQRLTRRAPLFALLQSVARDRQPAAQAIVIGTRGDVAVNLGETVAISAEQRLIGQIVSPAVTAALGAELSAVLAAGHSRLLSYRGDQTELELLLEYLPAAPALLVIGAGHDAEPLVRLAATLGWRVTVVDGRRHFARPERFPTADQVLCLAPDAAGAANLQPDAVVIMTHSFSQDRSWLQHFIGRSPPYLGQLGPKSRTDRLLGRLAESADPAVRAGLARLHAPVGLDLGGSSPEAVALAILAEAQAVLNGRQGGSLQARTAPIHATEPASVLPWPSQP